MSATGNEKPLTELATSAAERIAAARAEAALQIHLAGMEAKQAWGEARDELEQIESRLRQVVADASSGQARVDLHLALMDAHDRWQKLRPKLQAAAGDAAKAVEREFVEIGKRVRKAA